MKGKRVSIKTEFTRERVLGKKNNNWQGGKSFEPYGIEFSKKLKEEVRKRDNYRCQQCFRHQDELFRKNKYSKQQYSD